MDAMRYSFVALRIGTVPNGQASFAKPIIKGLACEGSTFHIFLSKKLGVLWKDKNIK